MKRLHITILFTMLMSMVGVETFAHDFAVANEDGVTIYYIKTNSTEVAVSYCGSNFNSVSNEYTGNVVIPESVTYDGTTYSVTSINSSAFAYIEDMTSITIPASVMSIGKAAFQGCSGLTSIVVDNGNPYYDSRNNCNAIIETSSNTLIAGCKNTIIPNSVTSIGEWAFSGCYGLTSIAIPNSVTSIGGRAFSGCSSLTSITIPNSVSSIGEDAFVGTGWYNNQPDGLVYAGKVAYKYKGTMPEDTSITIMEGTLGIADDVFSGCSGLTTVIIPNSVTGIGNYAFNGCGGLTSVTIGKSVTSIGSDAFRGCNTLTSIDIPNNVTSIGDYAFEGCSGLTSVTIGKSVTSIGSMAFFGCSELTSVTYHCKEIGSWFYGNLSIKDITIGDEVINIGNSAFFGFCGLTSLTIPNNVTNIGNYAFSGCSGLTSLTIPNSVTSIGNYVFEGCSGLTSLTIPYSVTSVGNYAFKGCSGLTSVTIPNSVTSIGDNAFENCSGLTSVTIPNSVTSIGWSAFYGCSGLTSVKIPNSVTSIEGYAFCGCSGLTSITISNNVTSIGERAFKGCSGLTSFTIPKNVTSISVGAFSGCSGLTSLTIPSNVTRIGNFAFSECPGLVSVKVESADPMSIGSSTFSNRTNATLYIPYGCKSLYENANYWKEFKEIVEMPDLTMPDLTICKGGKVNLPVSMENEEEITAFQFDVEVPEGITITDVQLGERKSDSHTVDFNRQKDGSYRVIGVSLLSEPFSSNEGELVRLMLSSEKDIEKGDYSISIKDIVLTSLSKGKLYPADVSGVLTVLDIQQGDADGDGIPDVADIVAMVNYILEKPSSDFVYLAADMNADGEVDIFDVMLAINLVLNRENSARSMARAMGAGETLEPMYMTTTDDGIRLDIDDAGRFTAFQFDVEVPEGTELTGAILTGSEDTHLIRTAKTGENRYRVMAVSLNNNSLMTMAQGLLRLSLSGNSRFAMVDNIKFVTPQGEPVYFSISQMGSATGIKEIDIDRDEVVYDMSGRRVSTTHENLPKGIYIINNKKVVIK